MKRTFDLVVMPNAADAAAGYEQKRRGEPALGGAALPVFERDRLVVAPWVEKVVRGCGRGVGT